METKDALELERCLKRRFPSGGVELMETHTLVSQPVDNVERVSLPLWGSGINGNLPIYLIQTLPQFRRFPSGGVELMETLDNNNFLFLAYSVASPLGEWN